MKNFIKTNWFKFTVAAILLIITAEVFFALYPYALDGYQLYKAYPPSELFFPDKNQPHIKAIDPFEK